jgi:hypothetical protein
MLIRERDLLYLGGKRLKQQLKELNGRGIIKMLISRKDGDRCSCECKRIMSFSIVREWFCGGGT